VYAVLGQCLAGDADAASLRAVLGVRVGDAACACTVRTYVQLQSVACAKRLCPTVVEVS
jgi:hypothetical protein